MLPHKSQTARLVYSARSHIPATFDSWPTEIFFRNSREQVLSFRQELLWTHSQITILWSQPGSEIFKKTPLCWRESSSKRAADFWPSGFLNAGFCYKFPIFPPFCPLLECSFVQIDDPTPFADSFALCQKNSLLSALPLPEPGNWRCGGVKFRCFCGSRSSDFPFRNTPSAGPLGVSPTASPPTGSWSIGRPSPTRSPRVGARSLLEATCTRCGRIEQRRTDTRWWVLPSIILFSVRWKWMKSADALHGWSDYCWPERDKNIIFKQELDLALVLRIVLIVKRVGFLPDAGLICERHSRNFQDVPVFRV